LTKKKKPSESEGRNKKNATGACSQAYTNKNTSQKKKLGNWATLVGYARKVPRRLAFSGAVTQAVTKNDKKKGDGGVK